MSIYVIPAIIALTAKLVVLFFSRNDGRVDKNFILMVLIFACHNLCEILLFFEYFRGLSADLILRSYYIISMASFIFVSYHVTQVSKQFDKFHLRSLLATVTFFTLILFSTNYIVAGAELLNYSVTATKGLFYWAYPAVCIIILLHTCYVLFEGYSEAKTHDLELKCIYTGFALLPHFIAICLVVVLMASGMKINGTVIFPVTTTLFLIIILANERRHKLTDVRRFIPFSDERKTSNQIMDIFSSYARDESNYRDSVSQIEKLLVEHKYKKNDCNASSAAELMGMPRSSLYSLFNRLDIKRD